MIRACTQRQTVLVYRRLVQATSNQMIFRGKPSIQPWIPKPNRNAIAHSDLARNTLDVSFFFSSSYHCFLVDDYSWANVTISLGINTSYCLLRYSVMTRYPTAFFSSSASFITISITRSSVGFDEFWIKNSFWQEKKSPLFAFHTFFVFRIL